MFQIGQKVILPPRAAAVGLSGGQIATVVSVEKGFQDMADVVNVVTADGSPYFDRDYQFEPA